MTNHAPTFTAPANQSVEATSAAGAVATYMAMGDDVEEGPVAAVCAPASGARFPLGTTTVTCTVTDRAGASASASFSVTVVDTTPPTGSCQPGVNPAFRTASGRSENGFFVVGGADATGTPALALGPFALAHGEAIKITRSPGARGVVLAGTMGPGGIRHFQVARASSFHPAPDVGAGWKLTRSIVLVLAEDPRIEVVPIEKIGTILNDVQKKFRES